MADSSSTGIVFRAAIYGGSGYADGNQEILAGLERHHLPLQLVPLGAQSDGAGLLPPARRRALQKLQRRRFNLGYSVLYQSMPAGDFETQLDARVRIGRTTFETDGLPPGWRERCNAMDEIWVPSTFNREMFAGAGVAEARLRVMPEGLDTRRFRPGLEPLPIPCRRRFNFLSVFDWIDRKGGDVLLRAFLDAFGPDDDVALILKVHKFDEPEADLEARLLDFIEREAGVPLDHSPCVILLRGLLPARDMPRLYNSADAFVLPSRGEGWGRPYMEAAACGLPVLATRWSGQTDFLNDGNSYLIEVEGVVPVPQDSDREIYIGQRWAEPSVEHLSQLMRQAASHPDEARARGQQARRDMVAHWDSTVLAPPWTAAFQALL
ncbi:MAG TPA: glycosyltransferase [Terriglobales bacterium]|nr:glycosyltransferase [Terriglobales bacterium]